MQGECDDVLIGILLGNRLVASRPCWSRWPFQTADTVVQQAFATSLINRTPVLFWPEFPDLMLSFPKNLETRGSFLEEARAILRPY